MASVEEGYEDSRFKGDVPENFHCAICLNVLKQPMQCVRNEHSFCNPCIVRYLKEFERCPTCMERLTLETLRPSRVITNLVSQFHIKCDNAARGCPDIMELQSLESHVRNCGFSPVKCPNDDCKVIINRKDRLQHENNECDSRRGKCVVCGKVVPYSRRTLHCSVTRTEMDEVREEISNLKDVVMILSADMRHHMLDMNSQLADANRRMDDFSAQLGEMKQEMEHIKKEVRQSTKQKPRRSIHSVESLVTHLKQNVDIRNDVIVAGGSVKSVEMLSWTTRQWTFLASTTSNRCYASSFVHQKQVYICGGMSSGDTRDSMEVLKFGHDAKWKTFPGKISQAIFAHSSVVYEDNLYIFGGKSGSKVVSDIYKISLVHPYSSQLVSHMPEPRAFHGVQRFDDKVVIVGGTTTGTSSGSINSVLVYDISNNCCQTLAPLPVAVCGMATVAWEDTVIILGGVDKATNQLNTVVSYNTKEGRSEMLPPMKYKREDCTAIITEDIIVVMGGWRSGVGDLNSVECFSLKNYEWDELPTMNEKRSGSTAVVC